MWAICEILDKELSETKYIDISNIKPLQNQNYMLRIVDTQKGHFVIVRLSDGQESPIYGESSSPNAHLLAYQCLFDALTMDKTIGNKGYFNRLCETELINNS